MSEIRKKACSALVAVCVLSGMLATSALAFPGNRDKHWRNCGNVATYDAVSADGVSCKTALAVARQEENGVQRSFGFTCKTIQVQVATGVNYHCTRGRQYVLIQPQ